MRVATTLQQKAALQLHCRADAKITEALQKIPTDNTGNKAVSGL